MQAGRGRSLRRAVISVSMAIAALMTSTAPVLAAAPDPVAVSTGANTTVNTRGADELIQDYQSPSVAVNPRDHANIVMATRFDAPDFMCQIWYSANKGQRWRQASYPPPPLGTCWAPSVAFDDSNHVYVAAQNRKPKGGSPQNVIVWTSADGGRTFGAPAIVPGSDTGPRSFSVQAAIAVDTTRTRHPRGPAIYVAWYAFPGYPDTLQTFLSVSEDGGARWSTPITHPVTGEFQDFPTIAIGPEGNVYVAYKDTRNFGPSPYASCPYLNFSPTTPGTSATCVIRVLRSTDGGKTFDSQGPQGAAGFQVAAGRFRDIAAQEQPGIATTRSGSVVVTFASLAPSGAKAGCPDTLHVYAARSGDAALSWSEPVQIDDDKCSVGASQHDPWVSAAPNGRIDAVFYDNRNDPAHAGTDAYYAASYDGGRTFTRNVRMTPRSFDGSLMFTPLSVGFQAREFDRNNGIASVNEGALAAWGATVTPPGGDSPSPASDVRTSWVTVAAATPTSAFPWFVIAIVAGALIAFGAAAFGLARARRRRAEPASVPRPVAAP